MSEMTNNTIIHVLNMFSRVELIAIMAPCAADADIREP